jgi:hypothetical protein
MNMHEKGKPISPTARRFVERKFGQFKKQAGRGCGLFYELYAQNFTDMVDGLHGRAKRADLREHIRSEARKDDDYVAPETGRWKYDQESNDVWFSKSDPMPKHCDERGRTEALLERATTPSGEATNQEPVRSRTHGIDRGNSR